MFLFREEEQQHEQGQTKDKEHSVPNHHGSVDEKIWVRPARVLQEVRPDDLVQARVDDRLEKLVAVPHEHDEGDPQRLVHVSQEVEDPLIPLRPVLGSAFGLGLGWAGLV